MVLLGIASAFSAGMSTAFFLVYTNTNPNADPAFACLLFGGIAIVFGTLAIATRRDT